MGYPKKSAEIPTFLLVIIFVIAIIQTYPVATILIIVGIILVYAIISNSSNKNEQIFNQSNGASNSYLNEYCYVYLMNDTTNNYYKIGISKNPTYREKTLQSEKPTIEMIANKKFPNRKIAHSFEKALHSTYNEKRVRGEWFDLSQDEVNDIIESLN